MAYERIQLISTVRISTVNEIQEIKIVTAEDEETTVENEVTTAEKEEMWVEIDLENEAASAETDVDLAKSKHSPEGKSEVSKNYWKNYLAVGAVAVEKMTEYHIVIINSVYTWL